MNVCRGLAVASCCVLTLCAVCTHAGDREDAVGAAVAELSRHSVRAIREDAELRRKWWDMIWTAWSGTPDQYHPDFAEFAKERYFDAPPAPYVHPRVFLRPEQLPELRRRLQTATSAQTFWDRYKTECRKLYADSPAGEVFRGLVENRRDADFEALYKKRAYEVALLMMWESLRVLIDDDKLAGGRLALATTHYARRLQRLYDSKDIGTKHYFYEHIRSLPEYMKEKTLGDKGYQEITGMFQEYDITLTYDFLYPYMTDDQRKVVRKLISDLSTDVWIHGMGIPDTGGNWGPHHWKGAIAALCIEGEEGYDPDTVKGLRQVMTSFYSGDFTEAGAIWEGLGKGTFGTEGLCVAALRGWDIAASQPVRRTVSRMMLHSMLPDFEHMITLGGLGSSHGTAESKAQNLVILKYFYPNDPVIDTMYRVCMGENYEWFADHGFNRHYAVIREPIRMLLCATDFAGGQSLEAARAKSVAREGRTFFCPEFAILSTRDSWGSDASWLYFFARTYNYGHTRNDRGHFSYAALGRQWSIYPFGRGGNEHADSYDAHNCSVMTIDGIGTLGQPARMVAFADCAHATFATADLKHSWDWRENRHNNPSDRINPITMAYMQPLVSDPPAWHHVPVSLFPHWRNPGELSGPDLRVPHLPVTHAFRTAGLVRGPHPYALVLDDLQVADRTRHTYTWSLALPSDLRLERVEGGDVFLAEQEGDRRLLLRILQADDRGRGPAGVKRIRLEQYEGGVSWRSHVQRLTVACQAQGVRMKVLLFAHRPGTPLPDTQWDGDDLTVRCGDQTDRFSFRTDVAGMTVMRLTAAGEPPFELDPKHSPLPDTGKE